MNLPKVIIKDVTDEHGWVIKRKIYVGGTLIPSENIEYQKNGLPTESLYK